MNVHWTESALADLQSIEGHLLVVSHTDRDDRTRIIGARRAARKERKVYEQG